MHPTLFEFALNGHAHRVGTYGAMLSLAIFVAGALAVAVAKRDGMDLGLMFVTLATTVFGAFVGGFILHVVVEWFRTGDASASVFQFGRVFYGSFLGGIAAFVWVTRRLKLPTRALMDKAVFVLAAAHAIGRLGCFLGGCCYGAPTDLPWAVRAADPLAPAAHPIALRHPTALYEALGVLLIGVLCSVLVRRVRFHGERFLAYVAAYAVLRFFLEFTRGDAVRGTMAGLSSSQWISLALSVGAVVLHSLWRNANRTSFDGRAPTPSGSA